MSALEYTPLSEIPKIHASLRHAFFGGIARNLEYRKQQLRGMYNLLVENEVAIREAVYADLGKPAAELMIGESGPLRQECVDAVKNLDKWAANRSVKTSVVNKFDNVHIRKDPLGLVLIIGAWNYPLALLLGPAIGAIAAGNTVIMKPSEVSPNTAAILEKLLPKYLDPRAYRIVNGAVDETSLLLELKFDHIFYTGSGVVGKIIMRAAANHLTPVTLELGGKSPAFVSRDVDVALTARRLAWGKFFNCGQTCIAPDYVIIERGIEDKFVEHFKAAVEGFFGANPEESKSYGRIVNKSHFNRLKSLLDQTKGKIVLGGNTNEEQKFFAPTVVLGVEFGDKLMEGEIFGPILPIVVVDKMSTGVKFVAHGDQPLALYIFSKSKRTIDFILDHTRSGGVVVNDSLIQFVCSNLPFGGVGPSGMGNYHGKRTFDIFSHERSTIIKSQGMEKLNELRYAPYSEKRNKWLDWFLFEKANYPENNTIPPAKDESKPASPTDSAAGSVRSSKSDIQS